MVKRTLKQIIEETADKTEKDNRTALQKFLDKEAQPETKKQYEANVRRFKQFVGVQTHDELIFADLSTRTKLDTEIMQRRIQLYLKELSDDGCRRATVLTNLWAIRFFYQLSNDIILNWQLLARDVPKDRPVDEDEEYQKAEMYTIPQQQNMLANATGPRDPALVTFYSSSGARSGVVAPMFNRKKQMIAPGLRIKHVHKISDLLPADYPTLVNDPNYAEVRQYKGYLVQFYADTDDEYFGFITEEAAKKLDIYLREREMKGEILKPESPLFRDIFDIDNKEKINSPRFMKANNVQDAFIRLQRSVGLRPKKAKESIPKEKRCRIRRKVKSVHGFRKFCDTTMMNCKPVKVDSEFRKLLLGHDCGLQENYYDYKQPESVYAALTEYLKAAEFLTIDDEERMKVRLEQERAEREKIEAYNDQRFKEMREEIQEMKKQANVAA